MIRRAPERRRSLVALACLPLAALLPLALASTDTPRIDVPTSAAAVPASPSSPPIVASLKKLSAEEAQTRIAQLRAEIAHHDTLYFEKAAPEISDFDYDQLKRELREIERAFPEAAARAPVFESPLGDDRSGNFPTYRHRDRMLSLDKTYDAADLRAFCARVAKQLGRDDLDYVVEPKFDGLAISVTYEKGKLVRAVTRGNGIEGDDITANVLTIRSLSRELRSAGAAGDSDSDAAALPDFVELRGELFISFAEFERINREREAAGEPAFANPRNLAAGTAKLTDPREVATRKLEIVFYGWGAWEPAATQPHTQQELHARIRAWGLPGVEHFSVARGAREVQAAIAAFRKTRDSLAFPTDGAVVKLDAVAPRAELGETDRAPRWAIAYKFAPERATTRVRAITIQVGRSGVLTPVAELEPVALAGSTIARATLHNRDALARADVRVGDFVFIEKAGEIIPAIVGVDLARRGTDVAPYVFPTTCPACGAAVVAIDGEVAVRCPNSECPAQIRRRLEHFASKECLDIDGLGAATIDALVEHGCVKNVADIFRLRREDVMTLDGVGKPTAENLLAAIERGKRAELWRFVYGLGIPRVGAATARDLARAFGDLAALEHARAEDFAPGGRAASAGIGDATAHAIAAYFAESRNRQIVEELIAAGVAPVSSDASVAPLASIAGKIFVLTGKLPTLTRERATAKIESAGGVVRSSVSRATDYVVAGADPGAKLEQARALGVAIIDESELLRMLAER